MRRHHARTCRTAAATLWTILTMPVLLILLCWAVESARLYLARQQLVISLESGVMAAAKVWSEQAEPADTLTARAVAAEFALANRVLNLPVVLPLNVDLATTPHQNADCNGDLLFGTMVENGPDRILNVELQAGCGRTDGPNAHAARKISSDGWQTVTLCGRNYTSMIVIATPVYTAALDPAVVRITNTTSNSFDFVVQDTNTGIAVPDVPVYFFVVEEGVYTEATSGVKMEAVKFNSLLTDHDSSWVGQQRPYIQAYNRPVVVGQVQSFNDPDWSVFWTHGGNRNIPPGPVLFVGKHVGQDPDITRLNETIGYVVIEQGSGSMNGLPFFAALGPDTIRGFRNSPPYSYSLPGDIASYAVAVKAAEVGGNGAWAAFYGTEPLSPNSLDLALDEYPLNDRRHTTEPVAFVVFGGPTAVRARAELEIDWMCSDLFGCSLAPTTITAEVTAMFDCEDRCIKLISLDGIVCP